MRVLGAGLLEFDRSTNPIFKVCERSPVKPGPESACKGKLSLANGESIDPFPNDLSCKGRGLMSLAIRMRTAIALCSYVAFSAALQMDRGHDSG